MLCSSLCILPKRSNISCTWSLVIALDKLVTQSSKFCCSSFFSGSFFLGDLDLEFLGDADRARFGEGFLLSGEIRRGGDLLLGGDRLLLPGGLRLIGDLLLSGEPRRGGDLLRPTGDRLPGDLLGGEAFLPLGGERRPGDLRRSGDLLLGLMEREPDLEEDLEPLDEKLLLLNDEDLDRELREADFDLDRELEELELLGILCS